MRALGFATALVATGLLAGAAAAQETAVITGLVRDSAGRPLPGALVLYAGTSRGTRPDALGRYRLMGVPAGAVTLEAVQIGFYAARQTVTVAAGDSVRLDFTLIPKPGVVLNDVLQLPPVVVTPGKSTQEIGAISTSIAVVTPQQLERRAVGTVDEAIDKAPGVQMVNGQINIRGSSGYVLGLGSRVLQLVDGVPTIQGDRGGIHWDLVPVDEIDHVEIVKGAGSSLYGSAALGGVVNLISRDIPEGWHARLRTTTGAYANPPHPEWDFRTRTGLEEGVDVSASYGTAAAQGRLAIGTRHSDGYREQDARDHVQLATRGTWLAAPRTRLDLSGAWASDQYDASLQWCTQGQCDDRGLVAQPFKVDTTGLGNHTVSTKGFAAATLRRQNVDSTMSWLARASWVRTRFTDYQRSGDDFSTANRLGAEVRVVAARDSMRIVTLGTELTASDLTSNFFCGGALGAVCDHTQGEYALYGQSERRVGRARFTTGARIDFLTVDGGSLTAVVSPRLAAVWPSSSGRWRASIGRGFRAPSMAERFVRTTVFTAYVVVPNPDLRSETAWAAEFGNTLALGRRLGADVSLFWTEARDLIEPRVDKNIGQIQLQNTPRARVAGADITLGATPVTGFTATVAYTFLYPRALAHDTFPERDLAFRPRHLVTVSGDFQTGPFEIGADFRYMRRFENAELFEDVTIYPGDSRVSPRVLDLRAGWQRGAVQARLQVANALNYIYNLVPRTLAPVRTVTLTLTWAY